MVALPGREDRGVPVGEAAGRTVHQVFIGSCTNARADDLAIAARILRGRRVHDDVRLIVVPASRAVMTETTRAGDLETLLEAGATFMPSGCAVCAGVHQGVSWGTASCAFRRAIGMLPAGWATRRRKSRCAAPLPPRPARSPES